MIDLIKISNFKSISDEELKIKPMTILTGTNSSGKSTLVQSILLMSYYAKQNSSLEEIILKIDNFEDIRNFYMKDDLSIIKTTYKNIEFELKCSINKSWEFSVNSPDLIFEENLFYISSNRIGQEDISRYGKSKFGINGEYAFGYFDNNKNDKIDIVIAEAYGTTLRDQLLFWINKTLDLNLELITQKISNENLSVKYKIDDFSNPISTYNVGSGVSYAIRILIIGLSLKKGDIFVIENPEIHLHPKAIANLMKFFVFLASNGVQVIIETHSEHIIDKLRHEVLINKINKEKTVIYYRKDDKSKFEEININEDGRFVDSIGEIKKFPTGFFDANLKDLMELM
ncbi:AAA family ATPase [Campylobacter corcagiensis]|uniref:DUF3696 domain-containing protein n=1 Tax=Campylobacter corcagiensis TaxID=1448857 RepID=A0A7M1LHT3_9BACT|nr:DUF3696 domain-containing protein [Campylobacter corcagiensis]QKF65505.1 ATP-binding protein (AAA domain) [Campylobacter corcagiensis]QOQ87923.1 DUF3696 domain-containing protein [Campylobacter corcagiensis]